MTKYMIWNQIATARLGMWVRSESEVGVLSSFSSCVHSCVLSCALSCVLSSVLSIVLSGLYIALSGCKRLMVTLNLQRFAALILGISCNRAGNRVSPLISINHGWCQCLPLLSFIFSFYLFWSSTLLSRWTFHQTQLPSLMTLINSYMLDNLAGVGNLENDLCDLDDLDGPYSPYGI